jgi:hypothetical protein
LRLRDKGRFVGLSPENAAADRAHPRLGVPHVEIAPVGRDRERPRMCLADNRVAKPGPMIFQRHFVAGTDDGLELDGKSVT